MSPDIQLNETQRTVAVAPGSGEPAVQVRLVHHYTALPADVWAALTDPAALARWFLPVTGDLQVGGTFQLAGNAGGAVLACVPGRVLRVSYGGPSSVVVARLDPGVNGGTTLTFEHTVPLTMAGSGAGALSVAPAWEMSVVGLGLFLAGDFVEDPVHWEASPGMQRFARLSIDAWAVAVERSETASAIELSAAVAASIAQFAPDTP
ncbi:ATPase [Cryobacterium melibiosiphilum]|uniref:ATPase n=1 Tax=Cryobacterium melibiosiphilum TaxID=995039 RepID=A0A3A5MF33_9MICO|nr:SRPBCC domain-containing protein [Cryobacterium melibiosiphilum]RJT88042.1 ATPase [Cryobacterium melibiosiphilum]